MGTRRKPSLDDAGKLLYSMIYPNSDMSDWTEFGEKRKYIKMALEVWREVEKAI